MWNFSGSQGLLFTEPPLSQNLHFATKLNMIIIDPLHIITNFFAKILFNIIFPISLCPTNNKTIIASKQLKYSILMWHKSILLIMELIKQYRNGYPFLYTVDSCLPSLVGLKNNIIQRSNEWSKVIRVQYWIQNWQWNLLSSSVFSQLQIQYTICLCNSLSPSAPLSCSVSWKIMIVKYMRLYAEVSRLSW